MSLKTTQSFPFKFALVPTLVYLCLLPVLISLGLWQWHRADEKRDLLQAQALRLSSEVMNLAAIAQNPLPELRYQRVQVAGHYDSTHSFLLDNQISAGKAGYLVLTPFIPDDASKAVLINRGWLEANSNRSVLPNLPLIEGQKLIQARLNSFPSVGIIIEGAQIPSEAWPSLVQVANAEPLSKKLGYALRDFQLELDSNQPDGFKRDWQTTTLMLPQQHIAYALQWFGLALTLTLLFFWYSFKRK
ncbi:MAG: SURF1 family protein [Methylococcaceae bacterium]